ncbi:MAG: hypothetical protein NTZ18_00565 [Candidatus Komeilibacteria bacterium]|nr:hypothetical protein [Candidatus Komeilibacteria bacterium]
MKLVFNFLRQNFLADIFLATFFIPLFSATIIVMSFLRFGSYGATALATIEHISKWIFFLTRLFRTRAIRHHSLTRFKKFLCYHWLVFSVIHFAVIFEHAIIKRFRKYILDIRNGKHIFPAAQQAGDSYQLPQIFQRIIAGCVKFKNFLDEAKSFRIFNHCVRPQVIQITKRGVAW